MPDFFVHPQEVKDFEPDGQGREPVDRPLELQGGPGVAHQEEDGDGDEVGQDRDEVHDAPQASDIAVADAGAEQSEVMPQEVG